jgi:biotin carboxylase
MITMKMKLLVLGASHDQVPAIIKARAMGLEVITADNVPSNPGHSVADKGFDCDTTDIEAVADLAEAEKVSGVLAPGTDVALPALAAACSRLGLPGPGEEAARVLTRKASFRELQRELTLAAPPFTTFNAPVWPESLGHDGGQWAIKPNVSSGSKGVFKVANREDFLRLSPETLRWSLDGVAVAEGWVDGSQHTCEGVIKSGRCLGVMFTDRVTAPPPWGATWGHYSPPIALCRKTQDGLLASVEKVFDRLGFRDGTFDCDFVAPECGGDPVILEMTPRLGGNSLSALYRLSMKADIEAYAIRHAVGWPQDFCPRAVPKCTAVIILGVTTRGRLRWDKDAEARLSREHWVQKFSIDLPWEAPVEPFANGRNRIGEAIICSDAPGTLRSLADSFKARLDVRAV